MRITLLSLAAAVSVVLPLQAQRGAGDAERWQIQTRDGSYLWDLRIVRLSGDSLLYLQAGEEGAVRVQEIREVRLIRKTTVRLGEGDAATATFNALTGGDDEVYDFQPLDFAARLQAIRQILLAHPPTP